MSAWKLPGEVSWLRAQSWAQGRWAEPSRAGPGTGPLFCVGPAWSLCISLSPLAAHVVCSIYH